MVSCVIAIQTSKLIIGINNANEGVYDGHGGDKASEYVCENLHLQFLECANKMGDLSRVEELEESLRAAILKVEEKWLLHAEEVR